jgi:hypothetical protein
MECKNHVNLCKVVYESQRAKTNSIFRSNYLDPTYLYDWWKVWFENHIVVQNLFIQIPISITQQWRLFLYKRKNLRIYSCLKVLFSSFYKSFVFFFCFFLFEFISIYMKNIENSVVLTFHVCFQIFNHGKTWIPYFVVSVFFCHLSLFSYTQTLFASVEWFKDVKKWNEQTNKKNIHEENHKGQQLSQKNTCQKKA